MSLRNSITYTLLKAAAPLLPTSSTDATPIVYKTAAAHGLSTGDKVQIYGHTTNIAANGTWTITKVDADDFSLDGSVGSGGGAGANSGVWSTPIPNVIDVQDFKTAVLTVQSTAALLNCTVRFVGSIMETSPDFAALITATNRYDYLDIVDLEDNASIDGETGLAAAGAALTGMYQVNVDGLKWLSSRFEIGTAGSLSIEVRLFSNQ